MNHTPGPWVAAIEGDYCAITADGLMIGEVWSGSLEADARLVSAAPDLLSACRVVYKMMDADPFDFALAGEILHRVLSKATDDRTWE